MGRGSRAGCRRRGQRGGINLKSCISAPLLGSSDPISYSKSYYKEPGTKTIFPTSKIQITQILRKDETHDRCKSALNPGAHRPVAASVRKSRLRPPSALFGVSDTAIGSHCMPIERTPRPCPNSILPNSSPPPTSEPRIEEQTPFQFNPIL